MSIYFHSAFGLNRLYMVNILKLALENPSLKDAELAKPFGYRVPFAAKYRSWLNKCGIVEPGFPVRLTEMGKTIWENDPQFDSIVTQWFMHHELTQHPTRVETWHFFAYEFLPAHEKFTREDLTKALMQKLSSHSIKHFGPGSKMTPVIARKLIECYTEGKALGRLQILRKDGKLLVRIKETSILGQWKTVEELIAAYQKNRE